MSPCVPNVLTTYIETLQNISWHDLFGADVSPEVKHPLGFSKGEAFLTPLAYIRYHRRRYRAFDYRFNIDSHIIARGNPSHPGSVSGLVTIPFSVLEIKTRQERPYLPFLGRFSLSQTSMSKYALCLRMLMHDTDALNKYLTLKNPEIFT